MSYKIITLLSISLLLLVSCQSKTFDTKQELLEYIKDPDNGYYQTKTINGVTFSLLYKPTDLLVSQEISDNPTRKEIDSLRGIYGKYAYYNLSMSKNNKELLSHKAGNRQDFGKLVNTLAFDLERNIFLLNQKKDTIHLSDYIYPRKYGMTNSTSLLLAYSKKEIDASEQINFLIKDLGFNTGDIKFKHTGKIIKIQPEISF